PARPHPAGPALRERPFPPAQQEGGPASKAPGANRVPRKTGWDSPAARAEVTSKQLIEAHNYITPVPQAPSTTTGPHNAHPHQPVGREAGDPHDARPRPGPRHHGEERRPQAAP